LQEILVLQSRREKAGRIGSGETAYPYCSSSFVFLKNNRHKIHAAISDRRLAECLPPAVQNASLRPP
jgi:hypothetical protein